MSKRIAVIAGPCAVESYEQTMTMAEKISTIGNIAQEFGIDFMYRGGAWKPRTLYKDRNGEKVFEGTREEGLGWLSEVSKRYKLPIVTECMSENDLRHFGRYLNPEIDFIQVGARNSQNVALLYAIGGTEFGVLLKNPQHGADVEEAIGSIQRLEKNREIIYCIRGQKIIPLNDEGKEYLNKLRATSQEQHSDARYWNNIHAIYQLRGELKNVLFCYDPSHVWGGKTDLMRRKIGEWAIKAIKEYDYDSIMVEVNDRSAYAKCDAAQALLTTLKDIDWSQTYVRREPELKPLTLVDITAALIDFQANRIGIDKAKVAEAMKELQEISWSEQVLVN